MDSASAGADAVLAPSGRGMAWMPLRANSREELQDPAAGWSWVVSASVVP